MDELVNSASCAHRRVPQVILATLLLLQTAPLSAQEFPSKTIEVITHAGPGGGTDITTRVMMIGGRKELGVDMLLVNKRGGAGAVSLNYLKSRPRDGHTLMTITPTHLFTIARGRSPIGIDDLVGIARAADDPQIIMVRSDSPYSTIEDLIGASKIKSLKWGITQIGSIDHVTAYSFSKKTGIKLDVVPFRGGGDVLTNLLGRNVQVVLLNLAEAETQIQSGEVRPLLVLTKERMKRLPDVPTSIEKGINAVFSVVRGFVVLKGVPESRIAKLEQKILAAMGHEDFQKHLQASGLDSESVIDRREWEAQFRQLYQDGLQSLRELGFVR